MNITVLAGYFTPEKSADTHLNDDLVRDLAAQGANVNVFVPFPVRGVSEQEQREYENCAIEQVNEHLRIHRVGKKGFFHKGLVRRGLNLFMKTWKLYMSARNSNADAFLVVSTPPFLGYAAILLAKKAPVVYKLQDIFPDSLIKTKGWSEKSIVVKILRKLEKKVYSSANCIVVMSNDMKQTLLERGVPEWKIQVIYDWIDINTCFPVCRNENPLYDVFELKKEEFIVSYAGNIGYLQNIETILRAAEILKKKQPDIRFVIIGDGAWKEQMLSTIEQKELDNVSTFPMQPLSQVSNVYSLADVGLVSLKPGVSKAALPSKTWSIMSAACPVICEIDLDSELSEIIQRVQCGISVGSADGEAMAEAILKLYRLEEQERVAMGKRGREYVVNTINRSVSTKKYYDVLRMIV